MNRLGNGRLSQRIAEETQLLAEEKWIIETLAELNRQKNSLQIERLHLEHQKAQIIKGKTDVTDLKHLSATIDKSAADSQPSKPDNMMGNGALGTSIEFNVSGLDDDACNNEELNLSISNSVFANQDHRTFDIEEEEEDMENCVIDMNMFMYGG